MKAVALLTILALLIWLPKRVSRLEKAQRARLVDTLAVTGLLVVGLLSMRAFGLWGVVVTVTLFALWKETWARRRPSIGSTREAKAQDDIPDRRSRSMTRKQALEILGLQEGASEEEIRGRYRLLMKKVHPDAPGGSEFLATQLNAAKDALLS